MSPWVSYFDTSEYVFARSLLLSYLPLMEQLANRLQRLRNENGLTIAQVSKAINVSASTYRDWEYGRSWQESLMFLLPTS
jgi:DNA-binding XRE family transcriptional regulator